MNRFWIGVVAVILLAAGIAVMRGTGPDPADRIAAAAGPEAPASIGGAAGAGAGQGGAPEAAGAENGRAAAADADDPRVAHVYLSPTCGCCKEWLDHLEAHGFEVVAHYREDISRVKQEMGIPWRISSCHTARIGGYLVEGHAPADVIQRLLEERPRVLGIAVPGMPMGSPGMEGPYTERYDILTFDANGATSVYERR